MIGQWPTGNTSVQRFVQDIVDLCEPASVHFCTGEETEDRELISLMVQKGTLRPLNPDKRPTAISLGPIRAMSPVLKTARMFAQELRIPPARTTTGLSRMKCVNV